jgi:hypothetical protein
VNELVGIGDIPLMSRGGRDIKKNAAKPLYLERTGVAHKSPCGNAFRNLRCERPPRLRRFDSFAIFSYWRSHPPHGGGDYSPDSHTWSICSQVL